MEQHFYLTLYADFNVRPVVPKKKFISIHPMLTNTSTPSWIYEYVMDEIRDGKISTWEEIQALKWTLMYIDTSKTRLEFMARKKQETFALFTLLEE